MSARLAQSTTIVADEWRSDFLERALRTGSTPGKWSERSALTMTNSRSPGS
jgi:hypothetical protein